MKNFKKQLFKKVSEMTEEEKKRNKKINSVCLIVLLFCIGVMIYACNYKTPGQKAALEASKAESAQRTYCVVAAEQEVDKYISGAKYPRDEEWYILKNTDDSGIVMWQISATISITNVVEKQPILVIISIIDDNHYKAHYVSVGDKVYFDDNKVSFNNGTTD